MHKVGPKGTVVIEKGIRERLGITPGVQVDQQVVGEKLVLTFFRSQPPGSAFGILAGAAQRLDPKVRARLATAEGLEAAVDQAWEEHARERYGEGTRG
ncbi:MAG TPA: AbrB/MazE/SpoVT family DNA-binding domain-containing protein [Armatimonadota bacterium]|nr:AbrB/MazE/SpoVT family DNA-binding domain-containing protein [Armatimonadota bacterium]